MENDNLSLFLSEFADRLIILAASNKDEQVAIVDGKPKIGKWRTLKNKVRVFIVDGKIEVGPPSAIGKAIKDLDWSKLEDDMSKHEKEFGPINSKNVREQVTRKYYSKLMELQGRGVSAEKRRQGIEQVWNQMAAEDDFHVIFLDYGDKPSKTLIELTKAFADYGDFPSNGTAKHQITYYKDRLSLLEQLYKIVPDTAKKDISPQIQHVRDTIERFVERVDPEELNGSEEVTEDEPSETPEQPDPKIKRKKKPTKQPSTPRTYAPNGNKNSLIALLQALLQALLSALVVKVVRDLEAADKSKNKSKTLHSVTQKILSHTNTKKRDKFFDVFEREFAKKTSSN